MDIKRISAHLNNDLIDESVWKANSDSIMKAAAVLVPFYHKNDQLKILLTKRNEQLKHHSGQISFPGGAHEAVDRNIRDTAIRETHEEVGIGPENIEVLGYLNSLESISGFLVTPFVGQVTSVENHSIDHREVAEVFGVPFEFFMNENNLHQHRMRSSDGQIRKYYAFKYNEHTIWGLTAHIIVELVNRIKSSSK